MSPVNQHSSSKIKVNMSNICDGTFFIKNYIIGFYRKKIPLLVWSIYRYLRFQIKQIVWCIYCLLLTYFNLTACIHKDFVGNRLNTQTKLCHRAMSKIMASLLDTLQTNM